MTNKNRVTLGHVYPYNLFIAVFGLNRETDVSELYDCNPQGVISAVETLDERKQTAICLRFAEHMTLDDVGKQLNDVTGKRVDQIIAKSLTLLRRPSLSKTMLISAVIEQAVGEIRVVERERDMWKAAFEGVTEALRDREVIPEAPKSDIDTLIDKAFAVSVEDLDLSVRTYNCLKRSGNNAVGDVFENAAKVDELGRSARDLFECGQDFALKVYFSDMRNMGAKSQEEFIGKIRRFEGFGSKRCEP